MKEHYKGIGHIAIYTVDMDQSIAFYEMIGGSVFKRDGVETPEGLKKLALVEFGGFLLELIEPPNTFGGLQNWFFTGPSGEQIELLQML